MDISMTHAKDLKTFKTAINNWDGIKCNCAKCKS